MTAELSSEFKQELIDELIRDLYQMQQKAQQLKPPFPVGESEYSKLERLVYMTKQVQLKLKMLGYPLELR